MNKDLWNCADLPDPTDVKIRACVKKYGGAVLRERAVAFTDGSSRTQFTIGVAGKRWHLVPKSRETVRWRAERGGWTPDYDWVKGE